MSDEMTATQRAFADALLACGAVKFGAFRLKLHEREPDAPLSPIYVDLRVLRSWPDAIDTAVATLAEMIDARQLAFTRYADIQAWVTVSSIGSSVNPASTGSRITSDSCARTRSGAAVTSREASSRISPMTAK